MRKTRILIPKYISNKDGLCMYKDNELVAVVYKKILGITPKTVNKTLAYEFGKCLAIFHKCVIKLPYNNRNALVDQVNSGIKTNLYAKNLPKGIIHGDLHLGNVMVESDKNLKITALLDFEEAHINLLIIDIAVTVMATCSKNNGTRVDIDLIRNTISGYQSIRKLEKFEKQNFKEAVNYVALCWIEWFKNNDYVKYAKRHLKRLNNFNKLNQGDYF
jgi:thiamine kinase-like enzyme